MHQQDPKREPISPPPTTSAPAQDWKAKADIAKEARAMGQRLRESQTVVDPRYRAKSR